MKNSLDKHTTYLSDFPSRDTKNSMSKKRHYYLRGRQYWLDNLAFWNRTPGQYSEESKDLLTSTLQP